MAHDTKKTAEVQIEDVPPINFSHERFKWFAVLTQSGMERKAKEALADRIKKLKMSDHFGHILIPTMIVEKIAVIHLPSISHRG